MSYLVLALGLLLAICGAASISIGYEIINVERGWASVIGGAAALSGGIVTIALGMILHALSGLRALLKAERDASEWVAATPGIDVPGPEINPAASRAELEAPATLSPEPAGGAFDAVDAGRPAPAAGSAGRRAEPAAQASIEDIRRVVAETNRRPPAERRIENGTPLQANDAGAGPPAQSPAPMLNDRSAAERAPQRRPESAPSGLPRALDLKDIAPQNFGPAPRAAGAEAAAAPERERSPIRASDGPPASSAGISSPPVQARPPRPASRPAAEAAQGDLRLGNARFDVIGQYESEGTTYVMFADGSIDARSDLGAFHFSSMAELKAFMEAQARARS
jgi:hypothetical protein